MTDFRYVATDLVSGRLLADTIPLNVESFSQQLNGGGSLSGQLNLSDDFMTNQPYLEALETRRSVLWVLADDYPVWNGVIWDWPDMSRTDGTLPISAQTLDSVFNYRLITATLEYPAVDIFQGFIDLCNYGTTKDSSFITPTSPFQGPASPLVASAAQIAGLIMPSGAADLSGFDWSASYIYSDLGSVNSAMSDLVTSGNLEYVFVPGPSADGTLATYLRLAYDSGLGRSYPESAYALTYPGNASDYGYQRTGSQSSNYVWAPVPPNGSAEQWESLYPHGVDVADLEAGYPLMESIVAWQGSTVTKQSQVDSFADGQMALAKAADAGHVHPTTGVQTAVIDTTATDIAALGTRAAGSAGQPITATSSTAANWQTPAAGVTLDTTAVDIQASPGTQAAGSVGKAADSGHVHPQPPVFAPTGLTGATSSTRFCGATASGHPTSGTFAVGDFTVDQTGSFWVCTSAGTPGTWTQVSGGSGFANPMTTLGDLMYGAASGTATRLAGSTSATKQFLTQTGTGSASAAPAWGGIAAGDLPAATTSAQGAVQLDGTATYILARHAGRHVREGRGRQTRPPDDWPGHQRCAGRYVHRGRRHLASPDARDRNCRRHRHRSPARGCVVEQLQEDHQLGQRLGGIRRRGVRADPDRAATQRLGRRCAVRQLPEPRFRDDTAA